MCGSSGKTNYMNSYLVSSSWITNFKMKKKMNTKTSMKIKRNERMPRPKRMEIKAKKVNLSINLPRKVQAKARKNYDVKKQWFASVIKWSFLADYQIENWLCEFRCVQCICKIMFLFPDSFAVHEKTKLSDGVWCVAFGFDYFNYNFFCWNFSLVNQTFQKVTQSWMA